jgi:ubiquinone/menaquinone biosynthesis C-methylase UbiE
MSFKLRKFVTNLHKRTKRDVLARMVNKKVFCMKVAKQYGKEYWDGNRKFGYGGYKYIEDRWKSVARKLIKNYNLKNSSKILDIGCGKGYLLFEIKKILPNIEIVGFDISSYAIKNSKKEIKKFLFTKDIRTKLNFNNKYFDLTISLGVFHNLELFEIEKSLKELNRVSKKSYIMVESYRNDQELFNLQCWALTCKSFFSPEDWKYIFKKNLYKGDFEFIYF